MFTTVAVSTVLGALNTTATQQLASSIEAIWATDFAEVALKDINLNRFGAQRHTFASYSLVYRLDIQPAMLRRIAFEHKHQYGTKTPTITEALEAAKVWLTFDADTVEVCCLSFQASVET